MVRAVGVGGVRVWSALAGAVLAQPSEELSEIVICTCADALEAAHKETKHSQQQ